MPPASPAVRHSTGEERAHIVILAVIFSRSQEGWSYAAVIFTRRISRSPFAIARLAQEFMAPKEDAFECTSQSAHKFKETGDSLYGSHGVRAVGYSHRRFVL